MCGPRARARGRGIGCMSDATTASRTRIATCVATMGVGAPRDDIFTSVELRPRRQNSPANDEGSGAIDAGVLPRHDWSLANELVRRVGPSSRRIGRILPVRSTPRMGPCSTPHTDPHASRGSTTRCAPTGWALRPAATARAGQRGEIPAALDARCFWRAGPPDP